MRYTLVMLLVCLALSAFASVTVLTSGQYYERNGRAFVPLRYVAESLGATVSYNAQTGYITISTGTRITTIRAGEQTMLATGTTLPCPAPFTAYGTTYVPARVIAESLGAIVDYSYGFISITTPGSATVVVNPPPSTTPAPTYTAPRPRAAPAQTMTVYTTRTGECYHRGSCSSLRYSAYATTVSAAKAAGYRPCMRCNPPY